MSMTNSAPNVYLAGKASLVNVALFLSLLETTKNRPRHLPGLGVFYGPSGWGKSTAAAVGVAHTGAYYVQAQSSWTRKAFFLAILKVMGIAPAKTLYEMGEQIATQLVLSEKALIIDEADHLVNKGIIEAVRDIYETTLAPVILIGEEGLPVSLKRWERIHGRVLEFVPAEPASLEDAKALREMYAKKVHIADDLLALVHELSRGSVRRICVNLERTQAVALEDGLTAMALATWAGRELYTGEAPARRISI
jgi:DNA transposition AAA+ family ATPase